MSLPKPTKADCLVLCAPNPTLWTTCPYRQFTSIDPAFKNIGMRIERRYLQDNRVEMIHFERISLVTSDNEDEDSTMMFIELQNVLNRLDEKMKGSHFFLVEKQQPISAQGQVHTNSKVMRVFGHILGVLMTRYGNQHLYPLICEVSPKLKGKMLEFKRRFVEFGNIKPEDIKKDLSYAQTKSVGVKIGIEFLSNYKDNASLTIINAAGSKKDDLTDTICQIEAFIKAFYEIQGDKIKISSLNKKK